MIEMKKTSMNKYQHNKVADSSVINLNTEGVEQIDPMLDDPHFRIIQQKIAEVGEQSGAQVRKAEIKDLEGLESC